MGQYNKILCLLFVIFIVSLLQSQCKVIEGQDNLNSFTNCIDDPEWFVENIETGRRMYCSDIGNGVSCYDRNASQVEGWERCLKTCGNCSTTKVTTADMKNMATFSGDPIDDFGVVLFKDDDRNWVGKDVGEDGSSGGEDGEGGGSDDVRNFIGTDESEDIIDIYDRLSTMESLYEMLMGSVSSCVDCSNHLSEPACNGLDYCQWNNESCGTKDGSDDKFYGCNGRYINCNILDDIIPSDDSSVDNQTEDNLSAINHSYLQHQGDQILFPTVEMSCNDVSDLFPTGTGICKSRDNYTPTSTCSNNSELTTEQEQQRTSRGIICSDQIGQTACESHNTNDGLTNLCQWAPEPPTDCPSITNYDDCNEDSSCELEKTKKDVCQSYFLLETSVTPDDDDPDNDDDISIGNRNSPTRISLYDMCPRQCVESCFNTDEEGE